jgi:energy-coupling factor transport system permease protein
LIDAKRISGRAERPAFLFVMHPFVRIICLITYAALLQLMQFPSLAAAGVLQLVALAWWRPTVFFILLRRARWLLLSILLIYAYATPGEYLQVLPEHLAPTLEGLQAGLMQMGRLASMLAALSLLLASSSREDIMAGIYLLLQPLRLSGLEPERFSARLWLTLHYVETMPPGVLQRLRQHHWSLQASIEEAVHERPDGVQLQFPKLQPVDIFVLMLLPTVFWVLA